MQELDPLVCLKAHIAKAGNTVKASQVLGISPAAMSMILAGKRGIGPRILAALGIEARTTYHRTRRRRNAQQIT